MRAIHQRDRNRSTLAIRSTNPAGTTSTLGSKPGETQICYATNQAGRRRDQHWSNGVTRSWPPIRCGSPRDCCGLYGEWERLSISTNYCTPALNESAVTRETPLRPGPAQQPYHSPIWQWLRGAVYGISQMAKQSTWRANAPAWRPRERIQETLRARSTALLAGCHTHIPLTATQSTTRRRPAYRIQHVVQLSYKPGVANGRAIAVPCFRDASSVEFVSSATFDNNLQTSREYYVATPWRPLMIL